MNSNGWRRPDRMIGAVNGTYPNRPDTVKKSTEEEDWIALMYLIVGTLVAIAVFGLGIHARPAYESRASMAVYLAMMGCSSVIAGAAWPIVLLGGTVCGVFYWLTYLVM